MEKIHEILSIAQSLSKCTGNELEAIRKFIKGELPLYRIFGGRAELGYNNFVNKLPNNLTTNILTINKLINTKEKENNIPKLKIFKTFDGKKINENEISHQHLSNWYWYDKIILGSIEESSILNIINRRFNGYILDYAPLIKFKYEISMLNKMGKLEKISDYCYNIIHEKVIVGKLISELPINLNEFR